MFETVETLVEEDDCQRALELAEVDEEETASDLVSPTLE